LIACWWPLQGSGKEYFVDVVAGGPKDLTGQEYAQKLSETLGQMVQFVGVFDYLCHLGYGRLDLGLIGGAAR
jgi:hypothetical protein